MGNTLANIVLPNYTKREELLNTVTHLTGVVFGIVVTCLCLSISISKGDALAIVSSSVYGFSMILLYGISSTYHGLKVGPAKKVMRVIDHCVIFLLIGGTYTPILLCSIIRVSTGWAWSLLAVVWSCAIVGIVFTALDLKKYSALSMACYIGMGWCIVLATKPAIAAIPVSGLLWLLAGGIAYTVGAVLYGLGKKHAYMHSVFHVFVLAGSVMQFICVLMII